MPEPRDTIQFVANQGDARLRLDQVLARRVTEVSRLSRTGAQRWIETGAVTIDGVPATRSSARVPDGATVQVALPSSVVRRVRPSAEPGDLDVRYEDEDLIVVNKPAGVVVHPSYKQVSGTLLGAILWHIRARSDVSPGILTRLDKDTTGLVIVALTPDTHAKMQRDAAAGRVRKEYLAVVHGHPHPSQGQIALPLARDPADRRRVIVANTGARSETRYERISYELIGDSVTTLDARDSTASAHSLVRCELVTGRTHQIRVHLASQGWPIVGDRVYGTAHESMTRQALHAWRVSFPHPTTRAAVSVTAPLPDDMRRLVEGHEGATG